MIALIPLLFAIAGALVYALATNPKLVELGRITFACGFLITMLTVSNHTVHLFP